MKPQILCLDLIHRGIENWMSVTWEEVEGFWKFLRDENIEMDAGEEEWRREQEKERERQEAAMKKMKNLPNDVKSKLGARFQEGQVVWISLKNGGGAESLPLKLD